MRGEVFESAADGVALGFENFLIGGGVLEILCEDASDVGSVVGGEPIVGFALIVGALPEALRRELGEEPGARLIRDVGIDGDEFRGLGEEAESVGGEREVGTAVTPVREATAGFAVADEAGIGEIEETLGAFIVSGGRQVLRFL